MASASGSNEEVSGNKRKADNSEGDVVKEAKTGDPIIDIVVAGEIKTIETWKRVVARLTEAGIQACDDYGYNSMKWKSRERCAVDLDLRVGHDTDSRDLYPTYTLYHFSANGRLTSCKDYGDNNWDDLIVQLKQWIAEMRNEAARKRILDHLQTELDGWKEFLADIPNEKIPVFPDASLKDGRLVLEWHSEDGNNIITVDRGYEKEDQPLGHEVCFRITTTPINDPRFGIRTCTSLAKKAIEKIGHRLKNDD